MDNIISVILCIRFWLRNISLAIFIMMVLLPLYSTTEQRNKIINMMVKYKDKKFYIMLKFIFDLGCVLFMYDVMHYLLYYGGR